jgi:hypothetical protein
MEYSHKLLPVQIFMVLLIITSIDCNSQTPAIEFGRNVSVKDITPGAHTNPAEKSRMPNGVEVQMLELDWVNLNAKDGVTPPDAYVHGELFGVGGVTTTPDNPRGTRSKSFENRCKGRGIWNIYDVICVDGVIKLSVNGRFINGISKSTQKKGYICLESEGAEIHFRNIKIIELPAGITSPEQTAPPL